MASTDAMIDNLFNITFKTATCTGDKNAEKFVRLLSEAPDKALRWLYCFGALGSYSMEALGFQSIEMAQSLMYEKIQRENGQKMVDIVSELCLVRNSLGYANVGNLGFKLLEAEMVRRCGQN